MTQELWVPLSALIGVLLSVLVSLIVSRRTQRIEAKKTYDAKLIDKRLEVYPSLYFILSNFIKELRYVSPSKDMLKSLLAEVDDWDSKHALYFSRRAASRCYHFRFWLNKLCNFSEEDFMKEFSSPEAIDKLEEKAANLEFSLKSDLGIYGIETSGNEDYDVVDYNLNDFANRKKRGSLHRAERDSGSTISV